MVEWIILPVGGWGHCPRCAPTFRVKFYSRGCESHLPVFCGCKIETVVSTILRDAWFFHPRFAWGDDGCLYPSRNPTPKHHHQHHGCHTCGWYHHHLGFQGFSFQRCAKLCRTNWETIGLKPSKHHPRHLEVLVYLHSSPRSCPDYCTGVFARIAESLLHSWSAWNFRKTEKTWFAKGRWKSFRHHGSLERRGCIPPHLRGARCRFCLWLCCPEAIWCFCPASNGVLRCGNGLDPEIVGIHLIKFLTMYRLHIEP